MIEMTAKEALRRIKEHMRIHSKKEPYAVYIDRALQIAVKALEKQISKKVHKENPICYAKTKDGQEYFAFNYFCPNCNEQIKTTEHHCKCGQALDWGDDE